MRFNNSQSKYPLPILRSDPDASDYIGSALEFDLEINDTFTPCQLKIKTKITEPSIQGLISAGDVTVSLAINCRDTYFYEVHDLSTGSRTHTLNFDKQLWYGKVYFTLILKAKKDISNYKPTRVVKCFTGILFDVKKGDILGISQEEERDFTLPPMPLKDDIFELVEQAELEDLAFEVDISQQIVRIGVGSELNKLVQKNMSTSQGEINNLASVYFPAVIDMLYQLKDEDCSGRAWYEAVCMAMEGHHIQLDPLDNMDPLSVAEVLLQYPYEKLLESGVR